MGVEDVAAAVDAAAMMDAHRHCHRRYEHQRRIHFQPLAHRRGMRMSECWRENYWTNTNIAVRRRCIDGGCSGTTTAATTTAATASGRICRQSEFVVADELGQVAS